MTKKTFGKIMPRQVSQCLTIMGEQIMLARKRRHLSMQDVADRATITRLTVSKVEHAFRKEYFASYQNQFGQLSREEIDKRIANHSVMMFAHLISGVMDLYIQYEIFTSLEDVRPAQLQSFILELKRKDQRALNIKDTMPEILFNKILMLNHLEALNLQELYGINLLSEITMSSVCIEASCKLFNIYKESIKCDNYRDNISDTITRIAESLKINI